jgi:hypothetical protein
MDAAASDPDDLALTLAASERGDVDLSLPGFEDDEDGLPTFDDVTFDDVTFDDVTFDDDGHRDGADDGDDAPRPPS